MDQQMPFPMQQGGGGFGRFVEFHRGGADPLDWAIFALLLVLILLVVAQLVVTLMRRRGGPMHKFRGGPLGPPQPPAFLRVRYARGAVPPGAHLLPAHAPGREPVPAAPPGASPLGSNPVPDS